MDSRYSTERVDDRLDIFKIDQYRALNLKLELPLQAGNDSVKSVALVDQVRLGFVAAGIFDLAVAQNARHDHTVILGIQRDKHNGIRARVFHDVLGIAVLPEQQIMPNLRIDLGFLRKGRRAAQKQQRAQQRRKHAFDHDLLRSISI